MDFIVAYDYVVFRKADNPFIRRYTEGGLIANAGMSQSQETGELERSDEYIGFAIITHTGDKCESYKPGDAIFYDRRSIRPLPVGTGNGIYYQTSERNIIAGLPAEDPALQEAMELQLAELQAQMDEAQDGELLLN